MAVENPRINCKYHCYIHGYVFSKCHIVWDFFSPEAQNSINLDNLLRKKKISSMDHL